MIRREREVNENALLRTLESLNFLQQKYEPTIIHIFSESSVCISSGRVTIFVGTTKFVQADVISVRSHQFIQ